MSDTINCVYVIGQSSDGSMIGLPSIKKITQRSLFFAQHSHNFAQRKILVTKLDVVFKNPDSVCCQDFWRSKK